MKVVFHDFPGTFHVHFPGLANCHDHLCPFFHVFPVPFNVMYIKQARLSQT